MQGFEEDKWKKVVTKDYWKTFTHKNFPFINLNFRKIQKGFRNSGPVWEVKIEGWTSTSKHGHIFYGRLLSKNIPIEFEKMLQLSVVKNNIMDYLFNGKY